MDSKNAPQKAILIELNLVKYDDPNQTITTVNEICKFHINSCKQDYANSRKI